MTNKEKTLNITEIYSTVQGETSLTGIPTTFIRLSGCNLRCNWCDSKYTFKNGKPHTIEDILIKVQDLGLKTICITGGEPLLQNDLSILVTELCGLNNLVTIETSGAISIENIDQRVIIILDIKCPASGMSEKNLMQNLKILRDRDEVKFVIQDLNDYHFAVEICKKHGLFQREKMPLFSCAYGLMDPKTLVEWILRDKIAARLNLQTHKIIWPANKRGV